MDLAVATNSPEPIGLGGERVLVSQLTLAQWGELQAWLKGARPHPVTTAVASLQEMADKGVKVDPAIAEALFRQAQAEARNWPPRIGSVSWLRAIESIDEGQARFLFEVLKRHNPGMTLARAAELGHAATNAELAELMRVAYYGDPPDPKSRARTETGMEPETGTPTPMESPTPGA